MTDANPAIHRVYFVKKPYTLGIILPASICKEMGIKKGDEMMIYSNKSKIYIKPMSKIKGK